MELLTIQSSAEEGMAVETMNVASLREINHKLAQAWEQWMNDQLPWKSEMESSSSSQPFAWKTLERIFQPDASSVNNSGRVLESRPPSPDSTPLPSPASSCSSTQRPMTPWTQPALTRSQLTDTSDSEDAGSTSPPLPQPAIMGHKESQWRLMEGAPSDSDSNSS